jgi:hypothetical protein
VSNLTLEQARFVRRYPRGGQDMKTADFYQGTADAMGVALYLYPDGSVSNSRKAGVEPTAIIKPHDHWKPADDHGLGEQIAKS